MLPRNSVNHDFLMDGLPLWIDSYSEELFVNQYQKREQAYRDAMFSELLTGGTKIIINGGDVDTFKKCLRFIISIHNFEMQNRLKEFDKKELIEKNNFIILACKYNRIDIITYIMNDENRIYTRCLQPMDKDNENHNAFYYAIRGGNIELLKVLLDQWVDHVNSKQLIRSLEEAYEELKLKNLILSKEVVIFIAERLINYYFHSDDSKDKKMELCLQDIEERGKLLIENIKLFSAELEVTDDVDDKLLLRARFIVSNINILKRQMKATYNKIFWEEMEFCLIIFIKCKKNNQNENMTIFKFMMTKDKLLNYLNIFVDKLENEMKSIHKSDVKKLSIYPNSSRAKRIPIIVKSDSRCEKLYEDYQRLKDAYCLQVISQSLDLSINADMRKIDGQLALKRTLQIIGEMMKNNWESPNMSRSLSLLLLTSVPVQIRQIVVNFHNSSSIYTHLRKLDNESKVEKDEAFFFQIVQTDLTVIDWLTKSILHVTLIHYITDMLKTIAASETPIDLTNYLKSLDLNFNIGWLEEYEFNEDESFDGLIEQLSNLIIQKDDFESQLIKILDSTCEIQGIDAKYRFEDVFDLLRLKNICSCIDKEVLSNHKFQKIKNYAKKALIDNLPDDVSKLVQNVVPTILCDIFHSFATRISWRCCEHMILIICKIHILIGYGIQSCEWLEMLRIKIFSKRYIRGLILDDNISFPQEKKPLSKKLRNEYSAKLISFKKIFDSYEFDANLTKYNNQTVKTVIEMLTLEIMSIIDTSPIFSDNYTHIDKLAAVLVGKTLYHHLVHSSPLLDIQLFDPSTLVFLNAKKLLTRLGDSNEKIGKDIENDLGELRLNYTQNLMNIVNQNEMFQAIEQNDFKKLEDTISKGADIHGSDYRGWTCLFYAAKGGNCDILEYILNQKINTNVRDVKGQTPLHVAVEYKQTKIVKFLVEKKINVDVFDHHQNTPLHIAARFGYQEILEMLMQRSTDIFTLNILGYMPLHYSISNGHKDIFEMLLKNTNKNIDTLTTIDEQTPLHLAAESGHENLVKYLISLKSNVNSRSKLMETPLHEASSNGHLETVKLLILNKAQVNIPSSNMRTPLHKAVENGHKEIVKVLLDNGANINAQCDTLKYTPLHLAIKRGSFDIVKLLVNRKADLNATTNEEVTAVHFAAQGGHLEIVKFLISKNAPCIESDIKGNTAVHFAASNGNGEIIEFLLKNGAKLEKRNSDHYQTPLHIAVCRGHLEAVKVLVNRGANFRTLRDSERLTALQQSAQMGHIDILEFFISRNANVNLYGDNSPSALAIAANMGHDKIVEILVRAGAYLGYRNEFGLTALHSAIRRNYSQIVEYLISVNANINQTTSNNQTALHIAAEHNHIHIVNDLIKRNKDLINAQDDAGRTPLYVTCLWNHAEMVKLLIKNGAEIIYDDKNCMEPALSCGNKDVIDVLLNAGVNANGLLPDGIPFLHRAVKFEYAEIVKILVAKQANVNAISPSKNTALMIAADNGFAEIATILLKNNADPDFKGKMPLPALGFAVVNGDCETVKVLFEYSKVGIKHAGESNCTLLHLAAQNNQTDVADFLISKHIDVNARDLNGKTPLHWAAALSHRETLYLLLRRGAHYNARDKDNKTAEEHARKDSVKQLLLMTKHLFNFVKLQNYYKCLQCLKQHALPCAVDINSLTPLHYACWIGSIDIVQLLLDHNVNVNAACKYATPLHYAALFGHFKIVKILLIRGAIFNAKTKNNRTSLEIATNPDIVNLLTLIEKTFNAVENCDVSIVGELKRIQDYDTINCILQACNKKEEVLANVAKRKRFPKDELAEIYAHEDYLFTEIY